MKKGYTLVELIVVILLIGIILSVVVPNMDYLTPKHRLRLAGRKVVGTLKLAKSLAVSKGITHIVEYDFTENKISIIAPKFLEQTSTEEQNQITFSLEQLITGWSTVYQEELPEDVKFLDIEFIDSEPVNRGVVKVEIPPVQPTKNHSVHLRGKNDELTVEVNALSCSAKIYEEYVELPKIEITE